jgi:delta-aminolevulinic acid dehydratase/porphobilinogen synthase
MITTIEKMIETETETIDETIFVMCDVCGDDTDGTHDGLARKGWEINRACVFCPVCNLG